MKPNNRHPSKTDPDRNKKKGGPKAPLGETLMESTQKTHFKPSRNVIGASKRVGLP